MHIALINKIDSKYITPRPAGTIYLESIFTNIDCTIYFFNIYCFNISNYYFASACLECSLLNTSNPTPHITKNIDINCDVDKKPTSPR